MAQTGLERELGITLAAGGVVVREGKVLVIHRHRYDDWSLPKGKRDAGESLLETALREVREETGYSVKATGYLGAVSYEVSGIVKIVLYWRMEAEELVGNIDESEVSEAVWMGIREAAERLTYAGERELLCKINEL